MSSLAIVSIILMIIQNELVFARVDNKDLKTAWFLRLIITVSTVILILLILYYHYLDITLYTFRNRLPNWCVGLNYNKIFLIAIELIICAIHPIPRSYPSVESSNIIQPNSHPLSYITVDIALSLPSKTEFYYLRKSYSVLPSVLTSVSYRSLGYDPFTSSSKYPITCTWIFQSCSNQRIFSH